MKQKTTTLLFLNAGRRVELIRSFRAAFEKMGMEGCIVTTDINGLAPALYLGDVHCLLPRARDPGFLGRLCDLCLREHVDLIIPLIDPDLDVLARNREAIQNVGTRLLLSNTRAIEICQDKEKTYDFLKRNGFSTPEVYRNLDEAIQHGFPLFIKPADGSASTNTFQATTLDELRFFAGYVENPLIQEFIDGEEITVDVFSDWSGEPLLAVPRRRLKVRAGEVLVGRIERDPELEQQCMKLAEQLETVGPVNVQVIQSVSRYYFIEMNPRFGGGYPLSIAAGAPIAEWTIQMALQCPIPRRTVELQDELTMMRFDDSFFRLPGDLLG